MVQSKENIKFRGTVSKVMKFLKSYLVMVSIVLLVIVTILVEPKFLSMPNLINIIRQFGPLSFFALGMTFVIMCGFIDLSISGIISLVVVTTYLLIEPLGQWAAMLVGIVVGMAAGYLNSILIITCGALTSAKALFITYGMSTVYGAIALIITAGKTGHLSWLQTDTSAFSLLAQGGFGELLSFSFLLFIVCLILLYIFQSKTYMGQSIYLTGGNKEAARLSGISIYKSISTIYVISGLMAAIGGIVLLSRVTTASPVVGKGYDTNAVLSVVVGGTRLKGGQGSVMRTVMGVLLVTLLSNCLNLLGLTPYMQTVFRGVILVIAIWIDNRNEEGN
ncbi:ABC transporter permease [Anaerosacchariphilus sp. NSJ-68]|uniref:Autoinducer 2 import system permease protein LsrD n=1 Tax=Anaerosacchariphilus hominis TaxID=2763017 RepID=A0A923LDZ2_9FIRM|nr:ABC transporter permease [Anaerosacchariphilus hominis]MBC5660906.1 ABC transporter permease [Anaerosacchariphilus hominis]